MQENGKLKGGNCLKHCEDFADVFILGQAQLGVGLNWEIGGKSQGRPTT